MKFFNRMIFITGVLLISNIALAADEDTSSIKTTINRKRILIGDRIHYKAEIFSKLDLEIEFPKFKDSKIGECEIKDSGKEIKRSLFGSHHYVNWLDITGYYVGKRKIPGIEIKYREKGEGNWRTLKTPEFEFTVESVLPRNVALYDVKDIKGPIYPFSFLKLALWIAAALLVLWLIIKLFKKFKKSPPPKLPYEAAIDALESAKAEFAKTGNVKDYYVTVSDAVRRYIETVFKLRAPEMTTQEFLASLGDSLKISTGYRELLKTFMEACDLVKFAKHAPSKDEIGSVFTTAKKFIEETKGEYVPV
ncbi:MAG: hypothetical protein Q8R38_08465 [Candidatus Omnitrophota bacterium]|nr:hypothetical protein [Candidatus Omnitrophota bacterium]